MKNSVVTIAIALVLVPFCAPPAACGDEGGAVLCAMFAMMSPPYY
jgi:hypothetical protein